MENATTTFTQTTTDAVDQREYRMAQNLIILYSYSREERRAYVARLEAKGASAQTLDAIRRLFRIPAEVAAESAADAVR